MRVERLNEGEGFNAANSDVIYNVKISNGKVIVNFKSYATKHLSGGVNYTQDIYEGDLITIRFYLSYMGNRISEYYNVYLPAPEVALDVRGDQDSSRDYIYTINPKMISITVRPYTNSFPIGHEQYIIVQFEDISN